jgi:hypothetical protein
MALIHCYTKLTPGFVAEFAAYLHFGGKCDYRYAYFVLDARVEGLVDVPWIACRQRPKDDDNFARRMGRQVTVSCLRVKL